MKRIYIELILAIIMFFWILCNRMIYQCSYQTISFPIIIAFCIQLFGLLIKAAASLEENE